jgi:hypothetical protein
MHPSSMPTVMPKGFFSSPDAERESKRSEVGGAHEWWRRRDGSDAPARGAGHDEWTSPSFYLSRSSHERQKGGSPRGRRPSD